MKTFTLTIVTDSKTIYSASALYCSVDTYDGSIGFEAFHEPFFGVLKDGSQIVYKTGGKGDEFSVKVKSGIVSFLNNTCTLTVDL